MPRFYFHIHDGRDLIDTDGIDLADEAAAQIEAVRLVGEVLKDDATHVIQGNTWSLVVVDAAGQQIYKVDLRITSSCNPTYRPLDGKSVPRRDL